jgi:uncharacterized protein (TIGR00730 family)
MTNVCVFCGSRSGDRPEYAQAAYELGAYLANAGHRLIYGGGSTGIMGAIADAVLEKSGQITGVIPTHLARVELMHAAVQDMRVTTDMHERKALMHSLSDIYVVLPGGFGTMEEFFEAVTWAQLDLHTRPIAVLNLFGIYDGLIQLMDTMMKTGFLSAKCRAHVTEFQDPLAMMEWLQSKTTLPGKTT